MPVVAIRPERPDDAEAIREVNRRAFGGPSEADLVDALRARGRPFISLVAVEPDGRIVGHIAFSPVTIGAEESSSGCVGLAPMAVIPELQRQGVGTRLVREGLAACRRHGQHVVVVVGHPEYYPRFGFVPASRFDLTCEFPTPDEAFMAMELRQDALAGRRGRVRYHPAFAGG